MRPWRLILGLLATLGASGGAALAQQTPEAPPLDVPAPTAITIQVNAPPALDPSTIVQLPGPETSTAEVAKKAEPAPGVVLIVNPDDLLPQLPLVELPAPTTLTVNIERQTGDAATDPANPLVLQTPEPAPTAGIALIAPEKDADEPPATDPEGAAGKAPLLQVPGPTVISIQVNAPPALDPSTVVQLPDPQTSVAGAAEGSPPNIVVVVNPDDLLPELPLVELPAPTALTVTIERQTGNDATDADKPVALLPQPADSTGADTALVIPDPAEVQVMLRRVQPQLSDLPPLPEAIDLTATASKPAIDSVPLPEAVDLTATASKPAVDAVPLPEAVDLTATASKPAIDAVPLPEAVDLTATASKPAVDAVPLPEAVDLTATASKPAAPKADAPGPIVLEMVSIQLDSVDTIRGFNPLDDQQVAQIEDSTGFANDDNDGNNDAGGGDLDLNALVPGGTLVPDTDGGADGSFFFSVFCLAPGNNINIVVGANGASLFGVTRNNVGGPSLSPTGRFTTFNGDNADRTFEFTDNVATVATVTDVRDNSLLANVTVAANSTGFILLANCQ